MTTYIGPMDDTLPDPAQRMIATSNGVYADRLFPVEILSAAGECILADGPLGGSESATVGFQPCAEGMTTTVTPRQASDAALLLGDEETYRYCPTGLSNARMGALIALVAAAEALGA